MDDNVQKAVDRHISVYESDFEVFNKIRNKYNLSWPEVFKRFVLYQNGIEYIFSAPGEMSKQLRLDLNTVMGLISMWVNNIRGNWYDIDNNPDISELLKENIYHGRTAVTIAAGPSLKERDHLKLLHDNPGNRVIFSTAHSLISCLEAGVIPDFTAVVDGSPKMLPFIDHPLVDKYADDIKIVFCSSVDHEVVKRWKGNQKYFFMSGIPQNLVPNVDTFLCFLLPKLTQLDTGGNSGAFNFSLAAYLGCSPIAMIGMDLGHPKGHPYEKTQYFEAYCQSIGREYKGRKDMIEKCYTDFHHPVFGTDCYYDFVYGVFRDSLFNIVDYTSEARVKAINCTEGGSVFHEKIECMKFIEYLKEWG